MEKIVKYTVVLIPLMHASFNYSRVFIALTIKYTLILLKTFIKDFYSILRYFYLFFLFCSSLFQQPSAIIRENFFVSTHRLVLRMICPLTKLLCLLEIENGINSIDRGLK